MNNRVEETRLNTFDELMDFFVVRVQTIGKTLDKLNKYIYSSLETVSCFIHPST